MIIANKPLNRQALILEEAETKIREIVKNDYFLSIPKAQTNEKVKNIIISALKHITNKELYESAKKSLANFYNLQYMEIRKITPVKLASYVALMSLQGKQIKGVKTAILPINPTKQEARLFLEDHGVNPVNLYGNALQKYSKDYFDKDIKPVFERLINEYPKDYDGYSLRGKAELEVRYQHNLDMVQNLKDEGHKLVLCSTHADCSERCAPWQGRVYSLDGTSGITTDGRKYVPLEEATDQYYTTKKGKRYKNGLLGFNCRHYLVPYSKGFYFPKPNIQEERKQYEITKKQRALERNVIKWKKEAITYKGINDDKYKFAKNKATEWNNLYIEYSKSNNRAYYPSRTKIL